MPALERNPKHASFLSPSNDAPRSRERERVAEGRVRDVWEKHIAAESAGLRCRVPPIPGHDQPREIIQFFGGADQLRNAVNQFQSLLYAA